jgi:predicted branched-subunit amino acid permease
MKQLIGTSLSISIAVGLYGVSFGALGAAAGLDFVAIALLSLLMFSGASQFAFIGVIGAGGSELAAILAAWLMGVRNSFYAIRLAPILGATGILRPLAAQLTIDESNAVSAAQAEPRLAKAGFWLTGIGVFIFWNLATFLGALGGNLIGSVQELGLDAAAAAAFLGLIWPRLRGQLHVALIAAGLALLIFPALGTGFAVLVAAAAALLPVKGEK